MPPSTARPFRFPSRAVVVVTHARARTNATRERTNARARAGIFFSSISSCRRSPVRVASSSRPRARARASERARSRIRAGMRFGCSGTRATATRETRRRAKAREACVGCFLGGRVRASVVASSSRGRRADDDGPSTGRRRRVDRVKRRGCRSETICSYGLESGVWSLARERRDDE